MNLLKKIAILSCVLLFLPYLKCQDAGNDPISIKVITTHSSTCASNCFSGYYILDAGTPAGFSSTTSENTTSWYETTIDDVDQIEIAATTNETATSIAIKIYRNDIKVKESVKDGLTGVTTLSLTYTYDEENQTTTK